jgi:surface antigen
VIRNNVVQEDAMRTLPRLVASVVVALSLAGCANSDYGTKQTVGALAGAGAGGLLGAQVGKGGTRLAATAAGTLLGAFLGSEVGRSLDRADALYASRAEYHALEYAPSGSSTPWHNPDSGHYGSVTPIETYETRGGEYCREFYHKAKIGRRSQDVYGTACRTPDGQWQVVN